MKSKELKETAAKSSKELHKKIIELRKEKIDKGVEQKLGKLKNSHEIKKIKKDIAQTMTLLRIKMTQESLVKTKTKAEAKGETK